MEFKFSCKWFEISFSGDPGYVERQIDKYEPYVLLVLKRIEEDIKKEDAAPVRAAPLAPPPQTQPYPPPNQDRQSRDHNRYDNRRSDHRNRGDRDRRGNDYNRRDNQRGDRRDSRPALDPRDSGKEEDDQSHLFQERLSLIPPEVAKSPPPDEKQEPPLEAKPQKPAEDSKPQPASEFASRRRAPQIMAEELLKTMDQVRPRTHHDRVMVFGHYMEKKGGGTDFTIAEIKRCYRAVNQDPGNSIEQVINHATRSGFILRHEAGRTHRFKLSAKGCRYVEDGLKLT